ncbi:MAG: M43 family zinc metalloprotease [Runella sp.]
MKSSPTIFRKFSTFGKWFLGVMLILGAEVLAQQRCGAVAYDSIMAKRYPYWKLKRQLLEDSLKVWRNMSPRQARTGELCERIVIPVVVHVIHNNASGVIGGANNTNISKEQIEEQIKVLNEDFRRKPGTLGFNDNPVGADTGIEFRLATIDPNGQPTTGITRTFNAQSSYNIFSEDILLANLSSWPTDRYLNIWVTRFSGNFLGIGQFPSVSGIPGLNEDNNLQERTDGLFVDFRVFGRGGAVSSNLYDAGRTTTHEVGHWLGLIHTWGDAFCGDDFCDDTPPAESGNQTSRCGPFFSNCGGVRTRNMTENYMDYSPDSCMNIFTRCQAERMKAVLEKAQRRARLVRYWCAALPFGPSLDVEIYPNPAAQTASFKVIQKSFGTFEIAIYSSTGAFVRREVFEDYPSWVVNVSLQDLPSGTYIARIITKDESVTKKLVIVR